MVAPKFCRVCGKPPLVINDIEARCFEVACSRKCVPESRHTDREQAVFLWNQGQAGETKG